MKVCEDGPYNEALPYFLTLLPRYRVKALLLDEFFPDFLPDYDRHSEIFFSFASHNCPVV